MGELEGKIAVLTTTFRARFVTGAVIPDGGSTCMVPS